MFEFLHNSRRRTLALLAVGVLAGLAVAATTATAGSDAGRGSNAGTLTLWVRAAAAGNEQRLVDAYNKTHKTHIKTTVVPDAQFVAKFGAAAGSHNLPDLVSVDVVYMPQFVAAGLFTDITARVKKLAYARSLLPAHMRLVTRNGKFYGAPAGVDVSSLFWNKDLFRQAGLDPNKAPRTWAEIERDADKITALGNGNYGFYFAGNCPGCNAFTFLPLIWASGGHVLVNGRATMNSPQVRQALDFYRGLWEKGDIPPAAKTDTGTTFVSTFPSGKIGIQGIGSFAIQSYKNDNPNLDFGVAPLPGAKGGRSAFAGGDVMGIPAGGKNVDAAWDFIHYYLSKKVQIDVVAKSGGLTVRTDLASNKYSRKDPRVLVNNQVLSVAQTPIALPYNELFNDANGPWLAAIRRAVFDGDVDGAVSAAQKRFESILATKK